MNDNRILRDYCEQLNRNEFEKKVEMGTFLGKYRSTKLTQEEIEKLNRIIFTKEIKN